LSWCVAAQRQSQSCARALTASIAPWNTSSQQLPAAASSCDGCSRSQQATTACWTAWLHPREITWTTKVILYPCYLMSIG